MLLVWYFLCILLYGLPVLTAQPSSGHVLSASSLDSLLQDYAFRAFVRPRTGAVYDGVPPANLTGMKISALRLRSGSLRRKGFRGFKEFDVPVGVTEQPYVERLVLVYHNLANWSSSYYPFPGYTYLTPMLGILAYDASNLSAKNLQELDLVASQDPIIVRFSDVLPGPQGVSPMCIHFRLDGSVEFNNVINRSVCSGTKQGHFSIVAKFTAPSPAPAPAAPSPTNGGGGSNNQGAGGGGGHKNRRKMWIIVGSVVGGALLLILLFILFACLRKYKRRRSLYRMEEAADRGEPLVMTNVGFTKAPVALETRTKPTLEDDYMP